MSISKQTGILHDFITVYNFRSVVLLFEQAILKYRTFELMTSNDKLVNKFSFVTYSHEFNEGRREHVWWFNSICVYSQKQYVYCRPLTRCGCFSSLVIGNYNYICVNNGGLCSPGVSFRICLFPTNQAFFRVHEWDYITITAFTIAVDALMNAQTVMYWMTKLAHTKQRDYSICHE